MIDRFPDTLTYNLILSINSYFPKHTARSLQEEEMTKTATGAFPPDDDREIRERNQRHYQQGEISTRSEQKVFTGMFNGVTSFVDTLMRFSKSPEGQQAISTGLNFLSQAKQDYRRKKFSRSIFISYRHSDAADFSTGLHEILEAHFGQRTTVFDNRNMPLGMDFRAYLLERIQASKVVLAVIGEDWLGYENSYVPRIEDTNDFVRLELETALEIGKPIIPVLVGRESNIAVDELPFTLRDLAYKTALRILPDRPVNSQLAPLLDAITSHIENRID